MGEARMVLVDEASGEWRPAPVPVVEFVVPGPPVAKGRPRVGRGPGGHPRLYTPEATMAWEDACAWYARGAAGAVRFEAGPVRLEVVAVLARPQRLTRRKDPEGEFPADCRPDLDNVVKAVLDGLNRSGVWTDDGQVAELRARKVWAAKGAGPEVRVRVEGLSWGA